ncbi:hypothetical protein PPYR_13169 [Photinus pyralis]|uniref:Endonuclease III homolog n=2 Tax=Photinus pyralis TaxID=7054 RepID=A0A5N4A8D0_PHOPY|nr:hypothetical protein PPYR_13169 [Photinus pyralis]
MKRITRNSTKENPGRATTSSEAVETGTKPNLSQFKLEPKRNLHSKRTHVPVEYEEPTNPKKPSKLIEKTFASSAPKDWEKAFRNLREMRKDYDAPVDTMGCDRCAEDGAPPEDQRLQSLISLMLSSQTKDQINHATMLKLREYGCNLTGMLEISEEKLGEIIRPVNFWKTKTKNIKRAVEMIRDEFNSDIPKTVEGLCRLPGVGPKMAHLCMKTAWGEISGIGVDTHVHRITNRLGWVKTKTPEDTRKALEAWLPRELWNDINLLMVGFGQQLCQPVKPQCHNCLNSDLCPTGMKELKSQKGKGK